MFAELTVVVEGAKEKKYVVTDYLRAVEIVRGIAEDAAADGLRTEVHVLFHEHSRIGRRSRAWNSGWTRKEATMARDMSTAGSEHLRDAEWVLQILDDEDGEAIDTEACAALLQRALVDAVLALVYVMSNR